MTGLMVNVDKAPVHALQGLNLILQVLSQIVCFPQGHFAIHDNINFDKVVGSRMVNVARIDLLDRRVKRHGLEGKKKTANFLTCQRFDRVQQETGGRGALPCK